MKKQMQLTNIAQAWEDFVTWVYEPLNWEFVDRPGRDRIAKAIRRHKRGQLGPEGIASLLRQYGRGRYEVMEIQVKINR